MCPVGLERKAFLFKHYDAIMMPLINDLLTRLLGPYWKYEAFTFTQKIGLRISWYGPSNLVSKSSVQYRTGQDRTGQDRTAVPNAAVFIVVFQVYVNYFILKFN